MAGARPVHGWPAHLSSTGCCASPACPLFAGTKGKVGPSDQPVATQNGRALAEDKQKDPNYCGSCYGAQSREGQCCNTCAEVRAGSWRGALLFEGRGLGSRMGGCRQGKTPCLGSSDIEACSILHPALQVREAYRAQG